MLPLEIRELVKLKKGLGGLEPPLNVGILIDREKSGKDHLGIVFTLRGELKIKWKHIRESGGRIYEGSKKDEGSMRKFLQKAVDEEEKGLILKMEPEEIVEKVSVSDLWNSLMRVKEELNKAEMDISEVPSYCENISLSADEIGSIHFQPKILEPRQQMAILKVLTSADDPTIPFFHRLKTRGKPLYSPYKKETIKQIKDHISGLEDLKGAFIQTVEEETEEGRNIKKSVPLFDDPKDATLTTKQREELDGICRWSLDFLKNGRWVMEGDEVFGLGKTPARKIEGFDLERFINELSHNICDCGGKDPVSDIVGMLLRLGKIGWRSASELVVEFNLGSGRRKFHREFSSHVLNRARSFGREVKNEEKGVRKDLRHIETYTIDPQDAKDFDDAVSISKDEDGNWEVWVHIADVSHYVRSGDLLDDEARYRGTSVYLPTSVIPMLPPELSENLCSLREGEDRLAVSTRLIISPEMEVISREHFRSVISVDGNLSYDVVNRYIEEGREPYSSLWKVSKGLKETIQRLDLGTPERKIRFTNENEMEVTLKEQTKAMAMIEQLMVLTNEAAASTIKENGLHTPYRVHPLPDRLSIEKFNATCRSLGLDLEIKMNWGNVKDENGEGSQLSGDEDSMLNALLSGGKISIGGLNLAKEPTDSDEGQNEEGEKIHPQENVPVEDLKRALDSFNSVLKEIESIGDEDYRSLLGLRMLRTMPRAFYSERNIGHFGLGSVGYCHFTSPIRRYPDILTHRAICSIIEKKGGLPSPSDPPSIEEISEMMEHVNEMSDEAEDWEREMVDVALATRSLMDAKFHNRTHGSMVRSITPSTIFVGLDDGVTEGRIPIRALSPLRLHIDDEETSVIASIEGNEDFDPEEPLIQKIRKNEGQDIIVLRIGDRKRCSIHSVSVAQGRIDISFSDHL